MNWEAIGAVGEAVYLAVQIRGDARAKRAATMHDQAVASKEVLLSITNSPGVADLFLRGLNDFSSLSGAQVPRFSSLLGQMCRTWEDQFFQWSEGHFDLRVWRGMEASASDIFAFLGVQAWWKTRSHWYTEEFQAFIEQKTAKGKAPTMYVDARA